MTPFSHSPPQPSTMNHATLCSGTTPWVFSALVLADTIPSIFCVLPTRGTTNPDPTPRAQLSVLPIICQLTKVTLLSCILTPLLSTFYFWFCPDLGQLWCCCFWTNIFLFQLSSNSLVIYVYSFQKIVSPYVFTYLFYLYHIPGVHSILRKSRTACYPYLCQYN